MPETRDGKIMDVSRVRYVLFDLDGTLIDSSEGITESARLALEGEGFDCTPAELRRFIGPPLRSSFGEYTSDPGTADRLLAAYRERYSATGWKECFLYPGIADLLRDLKAAGKSVVLASSKPDVYCYPILRRLGVLRWFDFVGGGDMEGTRDDKTVLMGYVLDSLGNPDPDTVLMIGDRVFDVLCAKNHGIRCVGAGYGFAPPGELEEAGAEIVVPSVERLRELLLP